MPITFSCNCGKTLRVPDEHAGRRAKCPACNAVVGVPGPEPVLEVVEPLKPATPPPGAPAKAQPVGRPKAEDDEYDGTVYGVAKEDRDDDDKPRAKGPKKLPNFRKGTGRHG
jgi:hypothetical protein